MLSSLLIFILVSQTTGTGLYDPTTQICCNGTVYQILDNTSVETTDDSPARCCGDQLYRSKYSLCCSGKVVDKKEPFAAYICCGQKAFEVTAIRNITDDAMECCPGRSTLYDPKEKICCGSKLIDAKFANENHVCCGNELIDSSKKICCDNWEIYSIADSYSVDRRYFKDSEKCCGQTTYLPEDSVCCIDTVHKKMPGFSTCCGNELVDWSKSYCHHGKKLKKLPDGESFCGNYVIHEDLYWCNNDKPTPGKRNYSIYYCGEKPYDLHTQICCGNNELFDNPPMETISCCNKNEIRYFT